MATLRLSGFLGENRALHPLLLPDGVGVTSLNQKPGRGDLRPWKSPLNVATVPAGRGTIYRMGRDVASDANYWLSWVGTVHAARSFVADDTTERTYYTGDGVPKWTDNTMALATAPFPTANRLWGVPAPTAPPIATKVAGTYTGLMETVFYFYTFVNDKGQESANSPISAANTSETDAVITLSSFAAAPSGNYGITLMRVYRTQATTDNSAPFFFMREIALGTASTTDDNRSLGEVCPSTTWLTPPGTQQGGAANYTEPALSNLTSLWNGMLTGISGRSVRFSEAYTEYAWPMAYDIIPTDGTPVALGKFGQSLLVLTTGRPDLVAGSSPDSMDQSPLEFSQACIAPRSAVSMGAGVAWASNDGLCWYGQGGPRILTAGIMTRDDWQALKPATIIGQMYEGLYLGSYDDGSGRKGFLIEPGNPQGIYFLSEGYSALHFDELQDQLYVLDGVNVQRWDAGTAMTATFKSKLFRLPKPTQAFACAEVRADAYPVTVKFYADAVLKHTQTAADANPFRLPGGFYADTWQLEVTTTGAVQGVAMAHAMSELAQT